ncbi:MAG: hypothetical protein ABEN55_07705 [Bradymonadaceae bacterium]
MKFILKSIGEYIFGVIFFMGAFVTIVGTGVVDRASASPTVRYFYWFGVAAFALSILILIIKLLVSDRDGSE